MGDIKDKVQALHDSNSLVIYRTGTGPGKRTTFDERDDGHCLFRAISRQLFRAPGKESGTPCYYQVLRSILADHIRGLEGPSLKELWDGYLGAASEDFQASSYKFLPPEYRPSKNEIRGRLNLATEAGYPDKNIQEIKNQLAAADAVNDLKEANVPAEVIAVYPFAGRYFGMQDAYKQINLIPTQANGSHRFQDIQDHVRVIRDFYADVLERTSLWGGEPEAALLVKLLGFNLEILSFGVNVAKNKALKALLVEHSKAATPADRKAAIEAEIVAGETEQNFLFQGVAFSNKYRFAGAPLLPYPDGVAPPAVKPDVIVIHMNGGTHYYSLVSPLPENKLSDERVAQLLETKPGLQAAYEACKAADAAERDRKRGRAGADKGGGRRSRRRRGRGRLHTRKN